MSSKVFAAVTIGAALTGSVAVSVLATRDLPRDEAAEEAVVGEEPLEAAPGSARVSPGRPRSPQRTVPYPGPRPPDRGR